MTTRLLLFVCFFVPGFMIGQVVKETEEISDTILAKNLMWESRVLTSKRNLKKALQKMKEAKAIIVTIYGSNSLQVADCWDKMGIIQSYSGNFIEANNAWDKSLNIRLMLFGEFHKETALAYFNLGIGNNMQGNYKKAILFHEKALNIRLKILGENSTAVAESYTRIATIYQNLRDIKRAKKNQEKALDIELKILGEIHLQTAQSFNNLGNIYSLLGNNELSIQYLEKAMAIRKQLLGETDITIAENYNNLGVTYDHLKKHKKSILCHKKAIEIWSKERSDVDLDIAWAYINLGSSYRSIGDYINSKSCYSKSLEIIQKLKQLDNPHLSKLYINFGNVYYLTGDLEKARENYKKALNFQINVLGEKNPEIAISYHSIGNVYKAQGKYEEAWLMYNNSLKSLNFSSINSLEYVFSIPDLIGTFNAMKDVLHRQYSSSKDLDFLYKSRQYVEQSVSAWEYQFQTIGEFGKVELGKELFSTYFGASHTYLLLNQITDSLYYLKKAFDFSERTKSYLLYSALQESEALFYSGIPNSLLEKEYGLRTNITYYGEQRQKKLISGSNETDTNVLKLSSQLFDLNRAYESLKQNIEQNYPDYYRLKYDLNTIGVEQIQHKLLTLNQTLLEYLVGDSTIFIYVINQDDYQVHEIKKDFPLKEWVKNFRKANDKDHYENDIDTFCQVAHDLYQKLIAPVAENLKEELIIIPDGILGYIPFEALLVEPANKHQRFKHHHYLLQDKQVSYSYSATLLKQMQEKKHKQKATIDFLAFAPYYDGDSTMLAKMFRYADPKDKKPLKPLPKTGEEVYGIQQIMGGKIYLDSTATEEQFVKSASNYRIIHLATHGKANDKVGDYSYLAFTEQKDNIENELLYVRDLYNLQLNADMVVLSACETGIGELQRGEGIISLARGMTYAGAKSIITSLWSVEDGRTKDLMISFYKHLKNGMTKDAALRQAKLDFINNENNDHPDVHPFYWSGFIGIGDMGQLFDKF